MLTLPSVLKIAKNEIASIYPWLFLLDITLPNGTEYHFVHNNEDVVFNGTTYNRFAFQLALPETNSEGNVPQWEIRVSNVTRALEAAVQAYQGATDSTVTITIVNSNYLAENYADLTTELKVLKTTSDANWITFTCGGRNFYDDQFPVYRYFADCCRWKFRAHECYYNDATASVVKISNYDYICYVPHISSADNQPLSGANWTDFWRRKVRTNTLGSGVAWASDQSYTAGSATCDRTLDSCRAKSNSNRFGGFPGLNTMGVRLV